MTEIYHDIDGNPCSIDKLCREEPEWAASRIREMTNKIASLLSANEGQKGMIKYNRARKDAAFARLIELGDIPEPPGQEVPRCSLRPCPTCGVGLIEEGEKS